ncbi:ABC transporter substrate-binding protein [Micromonospora sp. NPDC051196]|uniref:ABC transporter substrate-binding protein n=1 Tax=Micromonospora sp. NPDC051196 TaxID=3155281 RepID=UPI003445BC69
MKTRLRLIAALSAAVLALTACSSGSGSANKDGLFEFTLGSFNGEIYVLDYVADKQGFFEQNGLKASFISPQQGGASANTLFLGGTLKGWPGNPAPIMQNMAKGEDIKIAGWLDNWIPFGVVVPADSDLAALKDRPFAEKMQALRGKKIGLTAIGSLVYQSLMAGFASAGMTEKDATILAVGQPDSGVGQMEAGRIDAYVTYSRTDVGVFEQRANTVQFASLTGEEAPEKIRAYSSYALPVLNSLATENPEVVSGYVKAQKQAYDWTKQNIDQAAQIVADQVYKGQYKEIIIPALNEIFKVEQRYDFKVNPQSWDNLSSLVVELGMVEEANRTSLDYAKVVLDEAKAS